MSSLEDKINEHPSLSKAGDLVSFLDDLESLDLNTDTRESLHRIRRVAQHFLDHVASVDPELCSFQALKGIDQQLSKIRQELNQFKSNKSANHLINANTAADSVLATMRALWVPVLDLDLDQVREAIGSFRKSVGQNARYAEQDLTTIRQEIEELREDVSSLKASIKEEKARADSVVSELQSQFSKAEESRRSEFSSFLKEEEEKMDEARNSFEENSKANLEKSEKRVEKLSSQLNERSESTVNKIESLKDKAERLVHVIANTGMVGGYQRVANEERNAGRFWDAVSLCSLVGMVVFAIFAFKGTLDEFEIGAFLARFGVVLTFGALAGYGARQADKHHKVERRNRRVELELASIDPFLAELPEAERNQVKAAVADRLFAREVVDVGEFQNASGGPSQASEASSP